MQSIESKVVLSKEAFEEIQNRSQTFLYTSLKYEAFDDLVTYEIIRMDEKCILLYGYHVDRAYFVYHYAANNPKEVISSLKDLKHQEKISFIPRIWIDDFKQIGFEIYGVYRDYLSFDIKPYEVESPYELTIKDAKRAYQILMHCKHQSRGFDGQSLVWVEQYIEGLPPAKDEILSDSKVISDGKDPLKGVLFTGLYGKTDAPTLWILMLAVDPIYQKQGIAKKLLKQALNYGYKHHAAKAFLMADDENQYAIKLYESFGFHGNQDEEQIDLMRYPK